QRARRRTRAVAWRQIPACRNWLDLIVAGRLGDLLDGSDARFAHKTLCARPCSLLLTRDGTREVATRQLAHSRLLPCLLPRAFLPCCRDRHYALLATYHLAIVQGQAVIYGTPRAETEFELAHEPEAVANLRLVVDNEAIARHHIDRRRNKPLVVAVCAG